MIVEADETEEALERAFEKLVPSKLAQGGKDG